MSWIKNVNISKGARFATFPCKYRRQFLLTAALAAADSLSWRFRWPLSPRSVSKKLPLNAMAGERHMIRALCRLNETFDKDVMIFLALNRISALIGIFFGNALRYVYFGCLSSIERSFTKMCMRNFEVSLNFYKRKAGLNADKFATFWMLLKSFYPSFVLQITFIHSTDNRLNAIWLAQFRKNMKTCESVKRNAELFL